MKLQSFKLTRTLKPRVIYSISPILLICLIANFHIQPRHCYDIETNDSADWSISAPSKRQVSWLKWWSYDGISGPDFWSINKRWHLCGSGKRQSPIEILTERLVYDHLLSPLRFSWLPSEQAASDSNRKQGDQVRAQFINTNRGIELWLNDSQEAQLDAGQSQLSQRQSLILEGGPLSYAYKLYKIELHMASASGNMEQQQTGYPSQANSNRRVLGRDEDKIPDAFKSGKRSEHLIDGRDFDAELQLHFYNLNHLSNAEEARRLTEDAADRSGEANLFATVSIFIQKLNPSSNDIQTNKTTKNQQKLSNEVDEFLLKLLDNLPREWDAKEQKSEVSFSKSQLESLITTKSEYVTYQGSLNRPPCSENVDWIILNRALRIQSISLNERLFGGQNQNNIPSSISEEESNLIGNQKQLELNDNVRPVKARHRRLLRTSINVARSALEHHHSLSSSSSNSACPGPLSTIDGIDSKELGSGNGNNCTRQLALAGGSCSIRPNYVYELKYETY